MIGGAGPAATPQRGVTARLAALATTLVAGALLFTACSATIDGVGDVSVPSATARHAASSTASSAPPSESRSAPSSAPSAPGSSAPGAASGPLLTLAGYTIRLPTGWVVQTDDGDASGNGFDPVRDHGAGQLIVYDGVRLAGVTLSDRAHNAMISEKAAGHRVTRGPNRTVDGAEGFVLSGSAVGHHDYYHYGGRHGGHDIDVIVQFGTPLSHAQCRRIIDSILASLRWR